MTMRALLPAAVFAALIVASPALAQDPKDEPVPTMTTDDVVPVQVAPPADQDTGTEPADDGLTPEERADAAASKAGGKGQAAAAKPKSKVSQEELNWRASYSRAEEAAKAAERRALDAELRVNEMKNQMSTSGSTADLNAAAASLEAQGQEVQRLRAEAAAARAEADQIKAAGDRRKFKVDSGPARVTKDGNVNPSYYVQAVRKATADVADFDKRIEVLQNRIVDLRGQILRTTGSGDNFAVARIQEQITDSEEQLAKAQYEREDAASKLAQLQDEARRSGVRVP